MYESRPKFFPLVSFIVTSLHSFRTSTTLCVPDPSFEHEARHSLALSTHCPVQRELMAACGADGVPFELWRRFYYPNIRDQLIAKVLFWPDCS